MKDYGFKRIGVECTTGPHCTACKRESSMCVCSGREDSQNFGVCYECVAASLAEVPHTDCVGVPCQCSCGG